MKTAEWMYFHNIHSTRLGIRCHIMQGKWFIYWQHDLSKNKISGECTRKCIFSHVVFIIIIVIITIILSSVSVVTLGTNHALQLEFLIGYWYVRAASLCYEKNTHMTNAFTETYWSIGRVKQRDCKMYKAFVLLCFIKILQCTFMI